METSDTYNLDTLRRNVAELKSNYERLKASRASRVLPPEVNISEHDLRMAQRRAENEGTESALEDFRRLRAQASPMVAPALHGASIGQVERARLEYLHAKRRLEEARRCAAG